MYIMPYFFAKKIQDKSRITINIPSEGAIVSPVQMLVKKVVQNGLRRSRISSVEKNLRKFLSELFSRQQILKLKIILKEPNSIGWAGTS